MHAAAPYFSTIPEHCKRFEILLQVNYFQQLTRFAIHGLNRENVQPRDENKASH